MDEPEGVIPLLQYPDDTAGGLMTPAVITLRRDWRVQDALDELRRVGPRADSTYYLFVTDRVGMLQGVAGLRSLVAAFPETTIEAVMDTNVVSVPVTADQEDCARTLSRYGLLALPVVDELGRLVGVITADDLIEVAEDEATEDMYRMVGISGEERVFGPLRSAVLKRLPWLAVNMVTLFIAITVVNAFEWVIAGMVALATFLPLVSGEGGNAGSQTTTVIVRGMALGEVDERTGMRALAKELAAALINGAIIGIGTGVAIYIWKGEAIIAVAAGLAMVLNFLVAALAGVLVPVALKLVRVDPALASAAFVTAVTDPSCYSSNSSPSRGTTAWRAPRSPSPSARARLEGSSPWTTKMAFRRSAPNCWTYANSSCLSAWALKPLMVLTWAFSLYSSPKILTTGWRSTSRRPSV
jgi:magnesium transporter